MKKHYSIARILLCVLTAGGFFLACIHEESSTRLLVTVVFGAVALLSSFSGEKLSRRMVETGDALKSGWKRTLFYVGMLLLSLVLALAAYLILSGDWLNNSAGTLRQALMTVFFYTIAAVLILIPFVITMIVLILRKFIPVTKEPDVDETDDTDDKKPDNRM